MREVERFDASEGHARPRYYGKYPAVVLDNGSEGAHLGKVKVRVPAFLEEDSSGDPRPIEVMARPCLPPGFFFVPDVGAHVWVEFAAGDIDSPLWVGVWYPEDKPPKTSAGTDPTEKQKVIRTSSGHVVTLDDNAEKIVIRDRHENEITLEQGKVTVKGASVMLHNGGEGLELLKKSQDMLQFLMAHQHTNGNMGSPTGPPVPGSNDWFTRVVKAE